MGLGFALFRLFCAFFGFYALGPPSEGVERLRHVSVVIPMFDIGFDAIGCARKALYIALPLRACRGGL